MFARSMMTSAYIVLLCSIAVVCTVTESLDDNVVANQIPPAHPVSDTQLVDLTVSDEQLVKDFEAATSHPAVPAGVRQYVRQFLPSLRLTVPRMNPIAKTILFTLIGSAMIAPAQAGPFSYTACVIVCEASTAMLGLLACIAGCAPILACPLCP